MRQANGERAESGASLQQKNISHVIYAINQ